LRRIKIEEGLQRAEREDVLNIQPLDVRLLLHSLSSLECVERKAYNEKIQFAHMINHDIDMTITFAVEFLRKNKKCWHAKE
jgi:hypothetical protein